MNNLAAIQILNPEAIIKLPIEDVDQLCRYFIHYGVTSKISFSFIDTENWTTILKGLTNF